MSGNTSAERAARRRFAILILLHNRPHKYDEIITNLSQMHLIDFDPLIDSAIAKQQKFLFRHDRAALQAMDCQIEYDRHSKCYAWRNSPFGLHFDASQLATFALLCDTFEDATILHVDEIHNLLTYLVNLLSPDQQADRKSTRLNSSHTVISYAVFCLKKKNQHSKKERKPADSIFDPSMISASRSN